MRSADSTMTINADHQVNYDDCGLYAIAMAYDICNGVDPHKALHALLSAREII